MPAPNCTAKITSSQAVNARCRPRQRPVEGLARRDRVAAALKKTPITPTTTAAYPTWVPGTRLNSETAKALPNARSAAEARTCWRTSGREFAVRRSNRHDDEQEAGKRSGRGRNRGEQIPVGPSQHNAAR